MVIVRGKAKNLLEKAKESCILAVDVYNKPSTSFRSGAYVVLMTIAWTSLFHAIFEKNNINYFYRKKDSIRYVKIDGDKKAWELSECVKQYFKLNLKEEIPIKENIEFFIPLRNKIEHRFMPALDELIFGEVQALLHNFEYIISKEFGEKHSLNINLVFSLQFANVYPKSDKSVITPSNDFLRIKEHIDSYRDDLSNEVFSDQRYSFKAYLIPRLSNNENRAECAIEWVPYDPSNPEEMAKYQHMVGFIKEKVTHVANLDYIRAKDVAEQVKTELTNVYGCEIKFAASHHYICSIHYEIRPPKNEIRQKTKTKKEFCVYDKFHNDYMYTKVWVNFLIRNLSDQETFLSLFPPQRSIIFGLITSSEVIKRLKMGLRDYYGKSIKFSNADHLLCCAHYDIRPMIGQEPQDQTNGEFCSYEGNDRYLYTPEWPEFLIEKLKEPDEVEDIFGENKFE